MESSSTPLYIPQLALYYLQHYSSHKPFQPKCPGESNKKPRNCVFCNANGHDLNNCYNTRSILNEHKANQKPRSDPLLLLKQ
ncbi:hypothetical protein VP01_1876g8, partial [Puccinia sorghi]